MSISVFELMKIGIGPSSSHTVGPMRAAQAFAAELAQRGLLDTVQRLQVRLYGSLGATGRGHGSDRAVLLGLEGELPESVDPAAIAPRLQRIRAQGRLQLGGRRAVAFDENADLRFLGDEMLSFHPNGMQLTALDGDGRSVLDKTFFSIGGGFIVDADAPPDADGDERAAPPYPYASAAELLRHCAAGGLGIAAVARANELAWRDAAALEAGLDRIWQAMQDCVARGLAAEGTLPGSLQVRRRAAELQRALLRHPEAALTDPLQVMDWVNLYALAVNEENAAGGRVVTAPTNGAAGIVPAVLHYYARFVPGADRQGVHDFLLTAAAIGALYQRNASISGAEVGCQGEVGVACSMAAGALCAVLGGTPAQVENAAEIGMEHHLGLTCDPVGGLVQIPCIERNAIAAVKAINAARMALRGDGRHHVSLDQVIETMRQTGADMKHQYKETSLGGLAVNVVEC